MTEEFNDPDIDMNKLKEKCKNDTEFQEISYLKEVQSKLIMEGCKLNRNMLDYRGNRTSGWGVGEKRGGRDYFPPKEGWKGFGLNVLDKYDNGNNDWIDCRGIKNEWAVAYHGIGTKMGFNLEDATRNIVSSGIKAGKNQGCKDHDDLNHNGKKVGEGVYCSPNPDVMEGYAKSAQSTTSINGKKYMMGLMMRVKPDKIRISNQNPDYWVLNGTADEIRPYRLLVKELK